MGTGLGSCRHSGSGRRRAARIPFEADAYRYLHEGLTVLADHAPDLSTALERAAAAGYTHLNLDGTVIRTDRVAAAGPNKADLWWSGKHKHHGGNVQVIAAPDG